jgi:hypothetical protein
LLSSPSLSDAMIVEDERGQGSIVDQISSESARVVHMPEIRTVQGCDGRAMEHSLTNQGPLRRTALTWCFCSRDGRI